MKEITKLFQSPEFFNSFAKPIFAKDYVNFSFVSGEFLADGSYFVLYMSPSCAILLEIKWNVTKISIKRSIKKCLEVFDRYDIQPFLFILTDKTSSAVKTMLSSIPRSSYWKRLNNTVRKEIGLIFSKDSFSFIRDDPRILNPLMAFTLYFFGDEIERQKLRDIGNPMIKLIDEF